MDYKNKYTHPPNYVTFEYDFSWKHRMLLTDDHWTLNNCCSETCNTVDQT